MIDKIKKAMSSDKGFTLVEMMVVLIIIAVLIALGIRAYIGYIGTSKLTKANGDIATVQAALDAYYSTNQNYPPDEAHLTLAGITTYVVNGEGTPNPLNAPYNYKSSAANKYDIYTIASVNSEYVEAMGTNGVSSPATLTGTVTTN